MRTRNQNRRASEARETNKKTKEVISAAARAERLSITKRIASEIIDKQRELGSSHYGCKTIIYKKYKELYKWLDIKKLNWHMFKLRKSNLECSQHNQGINKAAEPPNKQVNTNVEPPTVNLELVSRTCSLF